MKVSLKIFRFSRKLVLIITGTLLLSGAAGATALYIGRDKLLGPSAESLNGKECTSVAVSTIHKKDRFWVRKYIKLDAADGLTRVKTALRVAGAVFEKEHPDLVQVVVIDSKGPDKRADMRGRAIGADVIFVAEPERIAATSGMPQFSATYTDAPASVSGEFFGQKTVMPEEDIHHLVASLSEKTDCIDPLPEPGTEGAAAEGEGGAKAEGKKAEKKKGEGEGEAAKSEGEKPAAEGETPAEGEKAAEGEKPAGEGEKAAAEGEKPAESKGWFSSVKSMVFGGGEAAKPEGEKPAADGEAAPAEGEKAAEGEKPATEETAADAEKPAEGEKPAAEGEQAKAEGEKPAESKGMIDSMKAMVFGGGEEPAAPASPFDAAAKSHASVETEQAAQEGDAAPAEAPAEKPAAEGASAEGGKADPFAPVALPGVSHAAKKPLAPQAAAEEKPADAKPHG